MSKPKHHVRQEVCSTRAPYRDGRKPTAVKVYTIHHESKFLLVQGVSATGVSNELVKLFETVGDIDEHKILDDYPCEQFTEVHLIKYKRIQSARFAKRKFDDWSFFGGVLHVCYAPEFETVQETREKLRERRRVVEAKTKQYRSDGTYSNNFTQTSHGSDTTAQTADSERIDNPHQTSSKDHNKINIEATNHQFMAADHIEQAQNFTSNIVNAQQYGVHDMPSYSSNTNQYYGGQSVTPQQQDSQSWPSLQNHIENSILGNTCHSSNDIIEQSQTNIQHQQTPKSYGEQVVEQARSLQNYGKKTFINRGNGFKRPNLANSVTNDSETVKTQDKTEEENEEQLILPPPPKQIKFSDTGFRKSQKYGGARVPSAQATFPAGFDARTDKGEIGVKIMEDSDAENNSELVDSSKEDIKTSSAKTMQDKVEENLKNKNVVIKEVNKKTSTVPRFIPRQALNRNKVGKATDKSKNEIDVGKVDKLNKEIRKNALTLGKIQGPVDLGPSNSKESLDPKEKSVIESTLEIRRKLKQVKE